MTKPTTTTNSADTIAQVIAMQSKRISKMEATMTRIETLIEQARPHEDQEQGVTP